MSPSTHVPTRPQIRSQLMPELCPGIHTSTTECQAKWSQRERCCSSNSLLIASAFTGRKALADTDTKHILYSSQEPSVDYQRHDCLHNAMTGSGCIYMCVYDMSSYVLLSEGIKLRHPVFHLGCTGVGGGGGGGGGWGNKIDKLPFAQMKQCHHMCTLQCE